MRHRDANAPFCCRQVHEMCRDTFVVLNTVGPFEKYATPVVKSCATLGTNYCDITGEVHWAALMEKKYGAAAAENKALIIPMCGFDSVPADITTFMVALHMAEKLGKECGQTKAFWHDMRGSMSGGTIHTMIGILTRPFSEYRDVLRSVSDSYSYNPPSSWRGTDSELTESRMPWFDLDTLKITAPFIMSFPNTRVVRRSAAVLNYGKRFRYRETYMAEWTAYDIATGIALTFAPILLLFMALVPPLRWFMTAFVLPAPGDGPSKEERESGRFKLTVIGRTDGSDEQGNGVPVTATFSAQGDPGYKVTSRMAVESAMAIVLHKDELPGRKGGFHTPSSGIGRTLISRLRASGIKMEVHDAEETKVIQDKVD